LGTRLVVAGAVLSFAVGATGLWAYGCSIYDESLLLPGDDSGSDAPRADAPPPPADASDAPAADPCMPVLPPARPTADDGAGDAGVVVAAIHTLDLGIDSDGGAPPPLGYDLDNVCTCFVYPSGPGPESCKPRVAGSTHCDEKGGRDNSGGELLQQFAQVSNMLFSQDSINSKLNAGNYGLLVRVRGYNGGANDTSVEVDMFISDGITPLADGGMGTPAWDGTDVWTLDSASVIGVTGGIGAIPNYFDTNAYVSNHVLVASVDFPLTLGASGQSNVVTLDLTGSVLSATLVPQGGTFALSNGILAGRWTTSKLLASFAAVTDPFTNQPICPGEPLYTNLKPMICKAADILGDPTVSDPTKLCDALSIGMGFTSEPAILGDVTTAAPRKVGCDSGPDDCQ
jgi:hypothetical protein